MMHLDGFIGQVQACGAEGCGIGTDAAAKPGAEPSEPLHSRSALQHMGKDSTQHVTWQVTSVRDTTEERKKKRKAAAAAAPRQQASTACIRGGCTGLLTRGTSIGPGAHLNTQGGVHRDLQVQQRLHALLAVLRQGIDVVAGGELVSGGLGDGRVVEGLRYRARGKKASGHVCERHSKSTEGASIKPANRIASFCADKVNVRTRYKPSC